MNYTELTAEETTALQEAGLDRLTQAVFGMDAEILSYLRVLLGLGEAFRRFTPNERRVIRLRYGLENGKSETLSQIAIRIRVTPERIRQLESKALRKLRHPSNVLLRKGVAHLSGQVVSKVLENIETRVRYLLASIDAQLSPVLQGDDEIIAKLNSLGTPNATRAAGCLKRGRDKLPLKPLYLISDDEYLKAGIRNFGPAGLRELRKVAPWSIKPAPTSGF